MGNSSASVLARLKNKSSLIIRQFISQIEGTQAALDDILDPNIEENTNRHVADVVNYIKASQFAKKRLNEKNANYTFS